jgi:hypothetical protein
MAAEESFQAHAFEYACDLFDVDHLTTKIKHRWMNGQVEPLNRTINDATLRRFHCNDHDQLRIQIAHLTDAYNVGRRVKNLKCHTPYGFIYKQWTSEPERFTLGSGHTNLLVFSVSH